MPSLKVWMNYYTTLIYVDAISYPYPDPDASLGNLC